MRAPILAVIALAACGGPQPPASVTPPENGTILERAPCDIPTDPDTFAAALDAYYREDIEIAGLGEQLAAQPLAEIFPPAEHTRLLAMAADGRCERVVYASDGLRVVGYVVRPSTPGVHPVILWLRGGNRDFGQIAPVTLLNLAWLAEAGFVVVAPQYRGVEGGEGTEQFGGDDVNDVLAMVPLARSLPDADVDHLYVLGGSRGAMQGLIALRRGLPARASAWRGGLYDLEQSLIDRPDLAKPWGELMPEWNSDRAGGLVKRSAVRWADELHVPMLLVHGRQDWRAALAHAESFDAALETAGVEHRLVIYEDDEHQLVFHRAEWLGAAVDWFRAH